jgi:hypothetical protein
MGREMKTGRVLGRGLRARLAWALAVAVAASVEGAFAGGPAVQVQGVAAGTMAALLGITSEVPFAREPIELTKLFNPYERNKFADQFARDMVVPLGVSWVAFSF